MSIAKLPHVGMQYEHQAALFEISDTFPDHLVFTGTSKLRRIIIKDGGTHTWLQTIAGA